MCCSLLLHVLCGQLQLLLRLLQLLTMLCYSIFCLKTVPMRLLPHSNTSRHCCCCLLFCGCQLLLQ
jgi:hypothetical protein